jgi:hypothetical protein
MTAAFAPPARSGLFFPIEVKLIKTDNRNRQYRQQRSAAYTYTNRNVSCH